MNQISPIGDDEVWFPVRVTHVDAGPTYRFTEVWLSTAGLVADRVGGRLNTVNDPAYAIDGSTFAVTAAGSAVQCLARRGPGAGGVKWELKAAASSLTLRGSNNLQSVGTGIAVAGGIALPAGTFLIFSAGYAIAAAETIIAYGVEAWSGTGSPSGNVSGYTSGTIPAGSPPPTRTMAISHVGRVTTTAAALQVNIVYGVLDGGTPNVGMFDMFAIPVSPA